MADRKLNHESLLVIEQPFLKVPLDSLQNSLRNNRRILEKDFSFLTATLSSDQQQQNKPQKSEFSLAQVDSCLSRLQSLRRKLIESNETEQLNLKRIKSRSDCLQKLYDIQFVDEDLFVKWGKLRLNRFIGDYLLRNGFHKTASNLVSTLPQLKDLVDVELFDETRSIEESLLRQSCSECLQWCAENKLALKKIKSPLELNLRIQEFVEMLRRGQKMEAIAYAKKFFPSWAESHLKQIRQVMALLVFYPKTKIEAYNAYFNQDTWKSLAAQFRADSYQLFSLPLQSLLSISLQCGLPALKTSSCYSTENKNIHCPVCTKPFDELASGLPFAHHVNSCIVCRLSGEIMDENNYPMVLPNGNVYSTQAIDKIAAQHHGKIVDPRSGKHFHLSQCRKAYLT